MTSLAGRAPVSGSIRLYVLSRKMTGLYGKSVEDSYWATPDFQLMRDAVRDRAELIAISDADRTDITWSTAPHPAHPVPERAAGRVRQMTPEPGSEQHLHGG